jgi:hypothetical protein
MFRRKEYAFLICENSVFFDGVKDNEEKEIRSQVYSYVNASINKSFWRFLGWKRTVKFTDFFTGGNSMVCTILATWDAADKHVKNRPFLPLLYEMYAFSKSGNEGIFDSYKIETKEFASAEHKIKIFKFKL